MQACQINIRYPQNDQVFKSNITEQIKSYIFEIHANLTNFWCAVMKCGQIKYNCF
jgi:hypothetical protein